MVSHTSVRLVNLVQDEGCLSGWGRVAIHGIGKLRRFGHVVTQKSLVALAVMRCLHPRTMAPKDAIALRYLVRRGSEDVDKLNVTLV